MMIACWRGVFTDFAPVWFAEGRTLFTQQAYSLGGVMRGGESRNRGGTWESF
jgi:hypothetical protein